MKKMLIASTSTVHGSDYLEYLFEPLKTFYKDVNHILFIPYARPGGLSHDDYTIKVRRAFQRIDKMVTGIHSYESPIQAIQNAEAIFVGGGNTFVLVKQLYKKNLMSELGDAISKGTPYLGTSAGSNICGLTMHTTNDMPIVLTPSYRTLGSIPFNINPHYLDPDTKSTHQGESRETRIQEFHVYNSQPVVGLRERSWLEVNGGSIVLKGGLSARIFERGKAAYEVDSGTELNILN